jgi:cytoskeleton protein RodZ
MTDRPTIAGTPPATTPAPPTAGARLQLAREEAGLTIDAVAAQLRLAPRQVEAIENDDYALLPGRTFVRGFVRNYARLLQLDADAIVATLPGNTQSSLESPTLNATAVSMGELPKVAERSRAGWARWFIPLILVAVVGAAAFYELSRSNDGRGFSVFRRESSPVVEEPVAPSPGVATTTAPGAGSQPLPNPLSGREPTGDTASTAVPANTPGAVTTAPATAAAPAAPAAAPAEATLALTFHDKSWTTIRDNEGHVLISKLFPAGEQQSFSGTPPFDLVIGNATEVTVAFNGEPVDLTPFIKSGVARLSLRLTP